MPGFSPGQRWMSETEPELGLGTVLAATPHQVTIVFRASGTTRVYSIESARLKRVQFRVGETVRGEGEREFKITDLKEEGGLIVYHSNGHAIPETLLSDSLSLSAPRERLLAGHIDDIRTFELRFRALQALHQTRSSPVRGFVGGRIALIPHQLYIAAEVASRHAPRVLLADEVGLGKTIESCLILHRLLITGRAGRVLILVPESLVHQWFIELLRRFNLWFAIFDEERCDAIETTNPEANPFLDDQLIICATKLLAHNSKRMAQAIAADWDLLIVDEAHHLAWSRESASPEYNLVDQLARKIRSVLLLTATPEQLGEEGHFARLRLLDPERFFDLDQYLKQSEQFHRSAQLAGKLIEKKKLTKKDLAALAMIVGEPEAGLSDIEKGVEAKRAGIIQQLLDQYGTGRVMFRNTRSAMTGFPKRIPHLVPLEAAGDLDNYADECETDLDEHAPKPNYDFAEDLRIVWLANFLRATPAKKILLLSRYREKVEAIDRALRERINTKVALFHEALPLLQRDRNAAWFAEEDGAQILICSEIGSEGRNFQFAHDLVLFDLPLDPELLEQRIGRLDRIGQTSDIHIHVPYVTDAPQELLVRWYNEGLNAFEHHLPAGSELYGRFESRLSEILQEPDSASFNKLLEETKTARADISEKLHAGRDRLLELHSFQPDRATEFVNAIANVDSDKSLDQFVVDLFDHFGIQIDPVSQRTFMMGAGDLFKEKLPGLPIEGLVATCDRAKALSREDIAFLSWDHPIVTSVMDMLLGSEQGNSAFALWPEAPTAGVLVEAIYMVEVLAPAGLHLDRFLPPTPIRVLLNHKRAELTKEISPEEMHGKLKKGDSNMLAAQMEELSSLLPGMIKITEKIAERQRQAIILSSTAAAEALLAPEITRLEQLQKVNPAIRADEIPLAKTQLGQSVEHLKNATLRFDSVRLILAHAKPAAAK
jgi:ATP-dependent helicase HepA